jgi:hypothetical protein
MARYIDADKLIDKIFPIGLIDDGKYTINAKAIKMAVDSSPAADVAPKTELAKMLSDLKKTVHDKAVYSYSKDMYPYINLKVFDAIVAEYISRLDKR